MIVDNGNLVKKVAFPSEVLLVHVAAVSIVIFAVGAVVCTIAGLLLGVAQPTWLMLALPLVVAAQFVLTLGIGLLLANLYVFVRDTAQLWRLATMSWMFLSPVFWQPKDLVDSGKLSAELVGWMEALNPAWSLMQAQRIALGGPEALLGSFWPHLGTAWAWAMGSMLVGYCVFMSRKHKFSDLI
jgi:lipopolysaccharide transport system permease protein